MKTKTNVKKRRQLKFKDSSFAVSLIIPAFIVLGIVVALPILKGVYVSFCEYKIGNLDAPIWNNFGNYLKIFKNWDIFIYFKNTTVFVLGAVALEFFIGLLLALLLNTKIKGRGIFRGLFLIPWTIPSVVVAILFRWMLHQQFGVLNYILYNLGISDTVNIAWTQYPGLAMLSVILASAWRQLPYMTVMILAALQSVDKSLIEAATIDGANKFRTLYHVVFPEIRSVMTTCIWISILTNFQQFTIVYNITAGGPVDATTTLGIAAYKAAFQTFDFGKSAAIGVVWLVVLFSMTLFFNKANEKHMENY